MENAFGSQKIKLDIFTRVTPGKTLPQVRIITPQAGRNYSFTTNDIFSKSITQAGVGEERETIMVLVQRFAGNLTETTTKSHQEKEKTMLISGAFH